MFARVGELRVQVFKHKYTFISMEPIVKPASSSPLPEQPSENCAPTQIVRAESQQQVVVDMSAISAETTGGSHSHATQTLNAWYYTLLLKVFSYKFAADDLQFYSALIKNPLAFFTTICTVLQSTELISSSEYLFYVYFGVQILCNFLTLLNMKTSYSERATEYKTLSQKYEGQSLKVRDLINMKEGESAKVRKLTKKLESMITKDESVSMEYENRAKAELKRNRRLFKMAGIDFTGETDENTPYRRPSSQPRTIQEMPVSAPK